MIHSHDEAQAWHVTWTPVSVAEEQRMVAFATRWAPFNAEHEYILPEFGLTPTAFYRRLLEIAETSPTLNLEGPDRSRLVSLCRSKLTRLGAASTQGAQVNSQWSHLPAAPGPRSSG